MPCVCILLLATAAIAESDLLVRIDSIVAEAYPADGPGAAAIVLRNGEILYRGASGLADMEHGVPVSPETRFGIASTTKQFTAACLLRLEERGLLSLDDPLAVHLPDFPTRGDPITLRHLLAHTSGLGCYTDLSDFDRVERLDYDVGEMAAYMRDVERLGAPDSLWSYSNTGYFLAGLVIEKTMGLPYPEALRREILEPLGLGDTMFGDARRIIPRRARPYQSVEGAVVNCSYVSPVVRYSAGGLLSTVDDLARWTEALFAGRVVSEENVRRMTSEQRLVDGRGTGYGLGFIVGEIAGRRAAHHRGSVFGFTCHSAYLPGEELYVAVLTNSDAGSDPGRVLKMITKTVLGM